MAIRSQREVAELARTLTRDCTPPAAEHGGDHDATLATTGGRNCIAVIGIDGYQRDWPHLRNAVNDATGVLKVFEDLGFQRAADPLLDDAATRDALNYLVSDQLRSLRENDNLIVFFAGHGHTAASVRSKRSYLIPVDADHPDGDRSTWILIEHWLQQVADLSPRHILVFLDSCHSGITLDGDIHGRSYDPVPERPGSPLVSRYSRRVITSAYDNERAADSGSIF